MDNTLKPVSDIEQMQGSLFSWNTSWLLFHAMNKGQVANFHGPCNEGMRGTYFHGQATDTYAYVWMVPGSLFSWITLWNLCQTLNRCKVAYLHGKSHDSYSMQWRKVE